MSSSNDRPIVLFDSNEKKSISLTGELCRSQGRNRWNGWYCSAGIRSLYVGFDGDVYAASCREGGSRGNIYQNDFTLKNDAKWLRCTRPACTCIPDMYAPKVKREEQMPTNFSELKAMPSTTGLAIHPDLVFSHHAIEAKVLIWEIGRRCNYDCSYCYPQSRSDSEAHKSLETLARAADRLHEQWLHEEAGHFIILGGEPTIHPQYLDFLRYLRSKNSEHRFVTVTNGSRLPKFFSKLFTLSGLAFSAHLEYLANPATYARFIETVATCISMKQSEQVSLDQDLQVRIMLKPGSLDLAMRLKQEIETLPHAAHNVRVMIDLLHESDAREMLTTYSQKELEFGSAGIR